MRFLIFLVFFAATFLVGRERDFNLVSSSPEQIVDLSQETDFFIGGIVSPLSGQVNLRVTDLVAKGAENIRVKRIYIPPTLRDPLAGVTKEWDRVLHQQCYDQNLQNEYKGWTHFPHCFIQRSESGVKVTDPNGTTLDFSFSGGRGVLNSSTHGMTNASGEQCSGKFDIRNIQVLLEGDDISVIAPDGTKRRYIRITDNFWRLAKETLPNGRVVKYHYTKPLLLSRVESLDPSEQFVYSFVDLDGTLSYTEHCSITTRAGDVALYKGEKHERHGSAKRKGQKFSYSLTYPPVISDVVSPLYASEAIGYENGFALNSYDGREHIFKCFYASGDQSIYRIESLCFPTGKNGEFVQHYQISYDPPVAGTKGGSTTAISSDGVKVVYTYNSMLFLESIKWFAPDGALAKSQEYEWDAKQFLKKVSWRFGDGSLYYTKTFQHDRFGNPEVETLEGKITGEEGNQTKTIRRMFSQDGKNLLLKEEHENSKTCIYLYHKDTNLISAKYTCQGAKIVCREICTYDGYNNLIERAVDDGTSEIVDDFAERKITRYRLSEAPHSLHMPEWIEEYGSDGIAEELLQKTRFTYDKRGNIVKEEIFGSNGEFCYEIIREVDAQGNILWEKNAIGQAIENKYDSKGRLIHRWSQATKLEERKIYNRMGQEIQGDEIADSGEIHATKYEYDQHGKLAKTIDYLDAATEQTFDPITQKVNKIRGSFGEITTYCYDPFGNQTSVINPLGFTTQYSYNIFGSVLQAWYPDEAREYWAYDTEGALRSHANLDGLKIVYQRDIFDRVIETVYEKEGQPLAKEIFDYTSFHLKKSVDKEGHDTFYEYDLAGRKALEKQGPRETAFVYDSLGRLESENYSGQFARKYKRDWLNRIVEETKISDLGDILWKQQIEYALDRNQKAVTNYPNNIAATEVFLYDSFGRQVSHTTAEGHETKTVYTREKNCLAKTMTDPNGISTITKYDPYDREIFRQIGSTYQKTQAYDLAGNLAEILEGQHITRYSYDSKNRLKTLVQACSTPDERVTSYTYVGEDRVYEKISPDGLVLTHGYTPFGKLGERKSSDGTIDQSFVYDKNGHLLIAKDRDHAIERKVDRFGGIQEETIDHQWTLRKTYDSLGRVETLTLPDGSMISYAYNSCYLGKVTRLSAQGEILFSHAYPRFDQSGRLLEEQLIHDAGRVDYAYTPSGMPKEIQSPYFLEQISYEPNGRVHALTNDGSYSYDDLSQLTQEKTHFYQYDTHYNRIVKDGEATDYNLLDQISSLQIEYDLRGNLTRKEDWLYTYDAHNRLTLVSNGEKTIRFTYDALDRQVSRTDQTETEYYLYHNTEELASLFSNGVLKDLKVPGLFLKPVAIELQGTAFAPILDYRGNVRHLIDSSIGIQATYQYTAFGEHLQASELSNPWLYSAKRFDPDLGLYVFGKRFYSPAQARWLTTDPAGFVDSTNLYAYVLNNPCNFLDPTGEFVLALPLLVWGAELLLPTISTVIISAATVTAAGAVAWAGAKVVSSLNEQVVWNSNQPYDVFTFNRFEVENDTHNIGKIPQYLQKKKKTEISNDDEYIDNKQRKGTPKSNKAQNKQANDAKREIEREIGRKLTKDEQRKFHDHVTKQGYNYQELIREGSSLFNGR